MIKPDGVQRGDYPEIMKRFEQRGFKLVALKLFRPGKKLLEEHYH
jgi:nucleoside-diphosphate kinase